MFTIIKYFIGVFFSLGVGVIIFIQCKDKSLYTATLGLIIGILASIIFLGQFINLL